MWGLILESIAETFGVTRRVRTGVGFTSSCMYWVRRNMPYPSAVRRIPVFFRMRVE